MIQLEHGRNHLRVPAVEAHAGEPDLPVALGDPLGLEHLVVDHVRRAPAVKMPHVQVVGLQLLQAGFQVGQRRLLVLGLRLAADEYLVAGTLQRRPHHAFVVAALVDAGGIEVDDALVDRALDDALVGSGHATEGDARDLHARFPQGSIGQLGGGQRRAARCGRRLGRRAGLGRHGGKCGKRQAGS